MTIYILLAYLAAASWVAKASPMDSPMPPVWPAAFETNYVLELPYVSIVQSVGLKIPVHLYFDGASSKLRIDTYAGLDSTLVVPDAQGTGAITYNSFPRITTPSCWLVDNPFGPTFGMSLSSESKSLNPLPDLSNWAYAGESHMAGGTEAYIWIWNAKHEERQDTYTFYTAKSDGRPLRIHMSGVNLFTGSHFDEYIVEFTTWLPTVKNSAATFKPPATCSPIDPNTSGLTNPSRSALQSLFLLPSTFLSSAGSIAIDDMKPGLLELSSRHYIDQWNTNMAAKEGFTLAPNRFSSISHDLFLASSLGHTPSPKPALGQPGFLGVYKKRFERKHLPKQVDYRGTGADPGVKDQAACGSCWTFGTTGTMTGTWWVATGEIISLSEQQIVDCSWDYQVNGCWGGNGEPALSFIADFGGSASEEAYPYLGVNSVCRSNGTAKSAFFSGYQTIEEGDEEALMEALALRGPLYVALDAGSASFKYYSSGVYHRADCGTKDNQLNHAVTLVGYGTTDDGVDYWLIRNSWSKLWGDSGYMKVTRRGNDCGITTRAVQAVVDPIAAGKVRAKVEAAKGKANVDQE